MSFKLPSLCLLLALSLHTGLAQECPQPEDGYELYPVYPGSRYKLPPFHLSWADAVSACLSDGGGAHLVVINSESEAEAVRALASRLDGTAYHDAWVGINDIANESQWLTVQGGLLSASGYDRWANGYPMITAGFDCGYTRSDALYRNYPCSYVQPFICEKPSV